MTTFSAAEELREVRDFAASAGLHGIAVRLDSIAATLDAAPSIDVEALVDHIARRMLPGVTYTREYVVGVIDDFARLTKPAPHRTDAYAPETEAVECFDCGGSGIVTGIGADPLPSGEPGEPYQTQESCAVCGGSGSLAQPVAPETERLGPLSEAEQELVLRFRQTLPDVCLRDSHDRCAALPAPETDEQGDDWAPDDVCPKCGRPWEPAAPETERHHSPVQYDAGCNEHDGTTERHCALDGHPMPAAPETERLLLAEVLVRPAAIHRPGCNAEGWLDRAANTCDCGGTSQYRAAIEAE